MDILQQCQQWHEEDHYQKIVDALEAVPEAERTAQMDMDLARAYNNLAGVGELAGMKLLRRALELMRPHEGELGETYSWNFRMGYALYYLDQEGRALPFLEKALELHPGDDPRFNTRQEIEEIIDACKRVIVLPRFSQCFRERVEGCWQAFASVEAEIRQELIEDEDHIRGSEIVGRVHDILALAFDEIAIEMGFNGGKFELILTPEGDRVKLFELVYFQNHAPSEVLAHWNVVVGRQTCGRIGLRTEDEWELNADDVQIWVEPRGEHSFTISTYCEKLLPMLGEEEGRAWWLISTLTDQTLGEISHMRYIDGFDVLREPKSEPSILLSELPSKLAETGIELSADPQALLDSYIGYEMQPDEDPEADWRLDVMAGSTCCPQLINGYLNSDDVYVDNLHSDGAVAGFLGYPLESLRDNGSAQKIFDFRDSLEAALTSGDGTEILTLTGSATGLYCGYVDFIAWDIKAVLERAHEFFEHSEIPWANFHTFRRATAPVNLKDQEHDSASEAEESGRLGRFAGSVLLSAVQWDKEQFIRDLYKQWGIVDQGSDKSEEDDDTTVLMQVDDMRLVVSLFDSRIPDNEAELNAENNYLWPEAVEVAGAHQAHIMVAVLGEESSLLEKGKLFTKALAVCCKQEYATGVFTSGVVFEPRFYEGFAEMMKEEDRLPIYNWIWFGLYHNECGMNGYTYGMDMFGKDEIEVLDTQAEPSQLRDFLASLVSYVLENDVTLEDGQTIGFSAEDQHTITRSPGIALPDKQMTLKISFAADDEAGVGSGFGMMVMDDASYHLESIAEKNLPVDPMNAYNHMAIYLRWCIEHDLMGEAFLAEHGETVEQVKTAPGNADLRRFIQAELSGRLYFALFNQQGRKFAHYYYGQNISPEFPSDIDDNALRFFGPERYHSDEFQDEAYLFIPFDEDYYRTMAQVIDRRFINWQRQEDDADTFEPSETAQEIMKFLDCYVTYFPAMADDDPITAGYSYARRLGVREGFVPVLVRADDETLLEWLMVNSDLEGDDKERFGFDPGKVAQYRDQMLSLSIKDGKVVLGGLIAQRKTAANDDGLDGEKDMHGEIAGGTENLRFSSYWNPETEKTYPLILARIPATNFYKSKPTCP